jgi:hypothetical protein
VYELVRKISQTGGVIFYFGAPASGRPRLRVLCLCFGFCVAFSNSGYSLDSNSFCKIYFNKVELERLSKRKIEAICFYAEGTARGPRRPNLKEVFFSLCAPCRIAVFSVSKQASFAFCVFVSPILLGALALPGYAARCRSQN